MRGGIGFTSGLAIDPQTPTTRYATSGSYVGSLFIGGVFKSTDGGESWRAVTDLAASPHALIGPLAIDPQTPATLYVGTRADGVFKSTDGGECWSAVTAGLPNLPVTALAIDPQTPTILYAGTERGGVFKSTDGELERLQHGPDKPPRQFRRRRSAASHHRLRGHPGRRRVRHLHAGRRQRAPDRGHQAFAPSRGANEPHRPLAPGRNAPDRREPGQ